MPRLRAFLLPLLVTSAFALASCQTINGWLGRDESDRNQQSLGNKRMPSANPEGSGPVTTSAPAPNADDPYSQYNNDGSRAMAAGAASMPSSPSATASSGGSSFFSRNAEPDPAYQQRRRPVENAEAEMGISGPTVAAAPITPLDASMPYAPMARPAMENAPASHTVIGENASRRSSSLANLEPLPSMQETETVKHKAETPSAAAPEIRSVTESNDGYPMLADTPEAPERMQAFRQNRADNRARLDELQQDAQRADSDRTALLSETGTLQASAPLEAQPLPARPMPSFDAAMADKETDVSAAAVMPTEAPQEKPGWFARNFGGKKAPAAETGSAAVSPGYVEPTAQNDPMPAELEMRRKSSSPVAEAEPVIAGAWRSEASTPQEEPIILRPPPGVAEVADAPVAETADDDSRVQREEQIALRAPRSVMQPRFLPDSRYAARRMADRAHSSRD